MPFAAAVLAVTAEIVLPDAPWLSIATGLWLAGMVAIDRVSG